MIHHTRATGLAYSVASISFLSPPRSNLRKRFRRRADTRILWQRATELAECRIGCELGAHRSIIARQDEKELITCVWWNPIRHEMGATAGNQMDERSRLEMWRIVMRRMVVLVFVLLGILACHGFSQTSAAPSSKTQDLRDCMDGFGTCDRSLLTNTQAAQIADLQHDQNFRACLSGYGECNRSVLTAGESKEVATLEQRRNTRACETTMGKLRQVASCSIRSRRDCNNRERAEQAEL